MIPNSRDELKRELHTIVYSQRMPMAQLCRDTGMDPETIKKALSGIVTDVTFRRFQAFFNARDKGRILKVYKQNINPREKKAPDNLLKKRILWMAIELRARGQKSYWPNAIKNMESRKLNLVYHEYDERVKRVLLKNFIENHPDRFVWMYDRWDARRWKEMIQHSEEDNP